MFLRILLATLILIASPMARGDFVLRDGDMVAFLGDSITAARGYTKLVEHYTLLRFPSRKVRFVNAGQGGDTAYGCLSRLQRDVFDRGATVVTVAFGINDIGWGTKANAESKARYLEGIRTIVEQCKAKGVRPIICSPAITAEASGKAESGFLQTMTDEGLALARSLGAETVDLQRGMREIQQRIEKANDNERDPAKHHRLHAQDGVHLNDLGQLAMGFALLKRLGAPADVSSAVIGAEQGMAREATHCKITEITQLPGGGVTFTREDEGLPITLGTFSGFDFRWVPIPDELNQYKLTVLDLAAGEYEITADGRSLGKAKAEQLARGLNITTMTADPWHPGGPWDAQSLLIRELVDARDKLWMSSELHRRYLAGAANGPAVKADHEDLDRDLIALQRKVAKAQPYRFEVRRVEPVKGSASETGASN